jgi:fatty acid desaturase
MAPSDHTDDREGENPYRAPAHSGRPAAFVDWLRLIYLLTVLTLLLVGFCFASGWLPAWLVWPALIVAMLVVLSLHAAVLAATAYVMRRD